MAKLGVRLDAICAQVVARVKGMQRGGLCRLWCADEQVDRRLAARSEQCAL